LFQIGGVGYHLPAFATNPLSIEAIRRGLAI
jgi:hypothetical protein